MLESPSKVNIGLQIVGRRADGYHFLESLFWPLNFCDEIEIEPASSSSVELTWTSDAPVPFPALLQNTENLIGKLISGQFGWRPRTHWRIIIRKRIPLGGGLGGISSNVGTVLRFFVGEKELSLETAAKLCEQIGADVPFFLNPRPSWVTGTGEKIVPLKIPPSLGNELFFLLVFFPEGTSTPGLFKTYREGHQDFSKSYEFPTQSELTWPNFRSFCSSTRNDLEKIAGEHYPLIGSALALLRQTKTIYSGLSGSGSTCFGIYQDLESREKGAKVLEAFCRDHQCRSVFSSSFVQQG